MAEFQAEGRGAAVDNSMIGHEIRACGDSWATPAGFAKYVEHLGAEALEDSPRPAGYVPVTTLWYVDGSTYLGRLAIRHRLTPALLETGYDVRQSTRRRGHATAMLRAALPVARSLGIESALVTCDTDNVASRKVIEANGGVLEDERKGKLRFWVVTRVVALVTGGSRGIGAATVMALSRRGFDVAFTYRSRKRRADQVVAKASSTGRQVLAIGSDMTSQGATTQLIAELSSWTDHLDLLVLNASGGLEPSHAEDPDYPMKINRDAQLELTRAALPLLVPAATVVLVTSHWAHLYGTVAQLPAYEPIAKSKHAGEQALRALLAHGEHRVRLLVVSGDLVEGTVTSKLLERTSRGLTDERRRKIGGLPTAADMGEAIATAALDSTLPSGHIVVIGGALGGC